MLFCLPFSFKFVFLFSFIYQKKCWTVWNWVRQPIRKLGPQCLNPSIPSVSFFDVFTLMQKLFLNVEISL